MKYEELGMIEERKNKMNKKPLIVTLIMLIVFIVTMTITSYAYFTATITSTARNTVVTTTSLEIEYTDGAEVGLLNALPGEYLEKTFKIENKGSGDTTYDVYMSDLINNFSDKSDLVYTLTSADGGANVSTQTQVPSASSKIVDSQLLRAGEAHNYTLRIDFLETNDNQDDNKGKTFSTIIKVNEVQDAVTVGYTIVSGDLDTFGSVVKIGDEEFYVLGQEDSTCVKLLAKYNLGVGNGFTTPTNRQDAAATGIPSPANTSPPYPGTVVFADTVYWANPDYSLMDEYNNRDLYVYNDNASIKTYVDNYVDYLNTLNVNVTGRLVGYHEITDLGCVDEGGGSFDCNSLPSWIYSVSYWTGSMISTTGGVRGVYTSGKLGSGNMDYNFLFGVRPLIILEK